MNEILTRSTFSILFFIHRSKTNKHGEHPIYCRLTSQRKIKEFSTHLWVDNSKWNPSSSKVIGNNESAKTANHTINTIRTNLFNIRADLQEQGKAFTPEIIVNKHLGRTEKKYTLLGLHNYFNEYYVKKLIGIDYANGTYLRYKTSYEHIERFIPFKYGFPDINLNDLTFAFASDYEFYLKTERNCMHNTTMKYIKNLKDVINFAVRQEWLSHNPLDRFKGKLQRVDKEYLTETELNSIETKIFLNPRLDEVRDAFIFCCYTGLAYSDVFKLSSNNIITDISGSRQIIIKRTKTDVTAKIPLLPTPLNIIKKYESHTICKYSNKVLPIKSNQKQNEYLKEIADLCSCDKKLTTHTARHTFATLMLTKGISIETVSSMLGHTNIKTTQIYGKIIGEKVTSEMKKIENIFNKTDTFQIKEVI